MDIEKLTKIYNDSGKPGARIFKNVAKKKGIDITQKQAQQFVSQQAAGQIFQGRLPSNGKITASRSDTRFQADLLDFSKRTSSRSGASKYALVVTDLFSKEAWVEKMSDKTDNETKNAMRKIIGNNNNIAPAEMSVDLGREFGPSFTQYLEDKGTQIRKKDPQAINSIAGVDRAQQSIKGILKNIQGSDPWSKHIKKATKIYNDREHSALYGESPDGVADNKVLQYHLEKENGEKVKHNNQKWRQRAGNLKDKGAFRIPLDRNTWERIDQPKFSGKVHVVDGLKGGNVEDTEGNSYPVRKVLAVPGTSQDIDLEDDLIPGSKKRKDQIDNLKQYSDKLRQELFQNDGQMSFARVSTFLRTQPSFVDTADVYKLPKASRYIKFLRLFGYEISGSGPGMVVKRPSNTSAIQGRPAGSLDLTPRAPRRGLPGNLGIILTPENPHRMGTGAFTRYEQYKSKTNIKDVRSSGATPQDLREIIRKGYGQLQ